MYLARHSPLQGEAFDILVVGAGAAGLSAALFAKLRGLSVLLIEQTDYLGGTTAYSGGTLWIPNSHHSSGQDSVASAQAFLDAVVGENSERRLRNAFLESAPKAIATLEAVTEVKFSAYAAHPDYEQHAPGATLAGRALEPRPFDGRKLGNFFEKIRRPIPEFMIFGGMMVDKSAMNHLLSCFVSPQSLVATVTMLARYTLDRLRYSRGTRLTLGNALVARLTYSLLKEKANIKLSTRLDNLETKDGCIEATLCTDKTSWKVVVRDAVFLAGGGFTYNKQARLSLFESDAEVLSPVALAGC